MNNLFKQLEAAKSGFTMPFDDVLNAIAFNSDGLVPAIAQQHDTAEVLMLAWMDRKAVLESLQTGRVCYWSRSRQSYWRKGETSGNIQHLVDLRIDCDGDALLLLVDQQGPACHTSRRSCFYIKASTQDAEIISDVEPAD